MKYKIFNGELQPYFNDALKIRSLVFTHEQGFDPKIDHDSQDLYSTHVVLYDKDIPFATARIYEFNEENTYIIGRVCVLKKYRKMKIGNILLRCLENYASDALVYRKITLHSQINALPFYEKNGYHAFGDVYDEEGQPHQSMQKILKIRGFEVAKGFENINLPIRKTKSSAGYDIQTIEDVQIEAKQTKLIKTGLKAYMKKNELLEIHIRSSIALKKNAWCVNNVGIIDADYYENEDNDGHILIPLYNNNDFAIDFKKHEYIAQAIFKEYKTTDNDFTNSLRTGGFGSTNEESI